MAGSRIPGSTVWRAPATSAYVRPLPAAAFSPFGVVRYCPRSGPSTVVCFGLTFGTSTESVLDLTHVVCRSSFDIDQLLACEKTPFPESGEPLHTYATIPLLDLGPVVYTSSEPVRFRDVTLR
jgi:hypothetical protein